jgi:hypothetical protein
MTSFILARCGDLGVSPHVVYTDETYYIDGEPYCFEGRVPAAGWALFRSNRIAIWRQATNIWTQDAMNMLAKHECAHIALEHTCSTTETEQAAEDLVAERWGE